MSASNIENEVNDLKDRIIYLENQLILLQEQLKNIMANYTLQPQNTSYHQNQHSDRTIYDDEEDIYNNYSP